MENLPGYEEAKKQDYWMHSYSGDKSVASYARDDGLWLRVTRQADGSLHATLSTHVKMVELRIDNFSFPHPLFHVFENQIKELLSTS